MGTRDVPAAIRTLVVVLWWLSQPSYPVAQSSGYLHNLRAALQTSHLDSDISEDGKLAVPTCPMSVCCQVVVLAHKAPYVARKTHCNMFTSAAETKR